MRTHKSQNTTGQQCPDIQLSLLARKADANAGGLDASWLAHFINQIKVEAGSWVEVGPNAEELMDEYVLMSSLDNPHIAKTYEALEPADLKQCLKM